MFRPIHKGIARSGENNMKKSILIAILIALVSALIALVEDEE